MGHAEAPCPAVVVSGTSSGVGKTSVAVGLMKALAEKGLVVQAFKAGPDFLDPMHHEQATGRPSINLDTWMLTREQVLAAFVRHTADADVAVVEGVMGLFDGLDGQSEQGSTAQLAKWLGAPVLLVLDCSAIARSAAAVVKGYQDFDPKLQLGGLLLNKVGGEAHTAWLKEAISAAGIKVPVLGGVPQSKAVVMPERHLGLHMPSDSTLPSHLVESLAELIASNVDLDAVLEVARRTRMPLLEAAQQPSQQQQSKKKRKKKRDAAAAPAGPAAEPADSTAEGGQQQQAADSEAAADGSNGKAAGAADAAIGMAEQAPQPEQQEQQAVERPVRIAVARDEAFCFYYHDSLALLKQAGAELVFFSPLHDSVLPAGVSGVYLGGGYPECHAAALEANRSMHAALRAFADVGGVVYAECGGLIYLSQSVQLPDEAPCNMAGLFPFKTVVRGKMAMGYVEVTTTEACPLFPPGLRVRGQVFHFSEIVQESVVGGAGAGLGKQGSEAGGGAAWQHGYLTQAKVPGAAEVPEGFCRDNVLASYVHLHFGGCPDLATALVSKCRTIDAAAASAAAAEAAEAAQAAAVQSPPPRSATGGLPQPSGSTSSSGYPSPQLLQAQGRPGRAATSLGHARRGSLGGGTMVSSQSTPNLLHDDRQLQQQQAKGRAAAALHDAISQVATCLELSSQDLQQLGARGGSIPHASSSCSVSAQGNGAEGAIVVLGGADATRVLSPPLSESSPPQSPREGLLLQQQVPYYQQQPYVHSQQRCAAPQYPPPHPQYPQGSTAYQPAAGPWGPSSESYAPYAQQQALHLASGLYRPGGSSSQLHSLASRGSLQAAGSLPHSAAQPYPAPLPGAPLQQQQPPLASNVNGYWPQPQQQQQVLQLPSRASSAPHERPQLPQLRHTQQALVQQHGFPLPAKLQRLHIAAPDSAADATGAAAGMAGVGQLPGSAPFQWHVSSHPPSDKIVSLSPGATEMLWVLGLGNRVVAVSDACDHPPQAAGRAKARHSFAAGEQSSSYSSLPSSLPSSAAESPSYVMDGAVGSSGRWEQAVIDERVLARERPGLIVCEEEPTDNSWPDSSSGTSSSSSSGSSDGGGVGRAVLRALVAVGLQHSCRVVCIRRRTLSDVLDSMLVVGEAAGVGEEAARTVDRLRSRLRRLAAAAAQAVAEGGRRPRVLILQSLQPLRTAGWWTGDMAALAGGKDLGECGAGDPPRELSWKEVQAYAPDVLVVAGMQGGSAARALSDLCHLAGQPGWWLLPAVKASAVYICDTALFCRAGPRLVEGVESLAHMLHDDSLLTASCPDRTVLKLSLRPGQRCRQRLLPNYFVSFT